MLFTFDTSHSEISLLNFDFINICKNFIINVKFTPSFCFLNSNIDLRSFNLILSIISQGEVYANEILSQLKNANLIVVEGTLYPLLSRLKTEKFLEYRWVESLQGPPRKYYQLTEKGKMALEVMDQVRRNMVESVEKIVGGE